VASLRLRLRQNVMNVIGVLIAVLFLLPLLWLIISAVSPESAIGAYPPQIIPSHFTLSNFGDAFTTYHFADFLATSLIVCGVSTALVVCMASGAAYGLARTHMKGKFSILVALLVVSTFPSMAIVTPLYAIFRYLGQLNSYQDLIIPYTALNLPFAIWLLRNYYLSLPTELEESGQVDGASPLRIVLRIIVPQALPGTFVAAVLTFAACWQEFLLCLSLNTQSHQNVAVGIASMSGYAGVPYATVFAASLIALVPIVGLVLLIRKWILAGAFQGGVKG
jgi:multiple sugar transport system permease protein